MGIRDDKKPDEITRELPENNTPDEALPGAGEAQVIPIPLTNPDKVFYPDAGLTKKELAEYYLRVAGQMLPEV